ncbi:MAG: Condensin subunit ScpA [Methanomicrobiales archaeon 53_19]|jgi:segregation and condensation protein A|uniref:segregation/condensation protein A n=1 Tax=Methanocalculus sp. TaxID=2004547 RepID=UPI000748941B|nr:ScpA family protein [Methanocalculus sp.]KUL03027.1 MAG: Condensin subunit ScpA [Methanomicrobiales archaeon 53_19]
MPDESITEEPISEEPIEILVRMAESGEIDPWNVDIVLLTDRFLSELERRRELDLRISGRTLLYASILLRMKSDALIERVPVPEADDLDDEDYGGELFFDGDPDGEGIASHLGPIEVLEREIQRRIKRKEYRTRPVTLYELITQLKLAEKEERRRQRRRHLADDDDLFVIAEDVVEIAHEEAFEEASSMIYATLLLLDPDGSNPVPLSRIASEIGCHLYDVYIPTLFLMLEGRADLIQEDFYGEILVARVYVPAI